MAYRLVTLVGGIVFVAVLYGLIWLLARWFLRNHGVVESLNDRATNLATWTFSGVCIGLAFAVFGAFVLGPWAFYRTLRAHHVPVSDGAAVWWGLGIVLVALGLTASGFALFLWIIGVL
ncbi:hypothetical protein SAMN05216203_2794 [Marinobacter daqiaonensis]|uniref:Uncharacterized protein n=1 Tax=Marinobacter daqiaonensis TaxID=650891 RepID=A0A1I6J981_9GAMM|nr:hypothetical protein [Marinobacter daqiaonensis]SFR75481.1 hypothetical protein SAMN05216203_2794 [Marinobacter daqiaonensis]